MAPGVLACNTHDKHVVPHIRLIKGATGDTCAAGAAVLHPEVVTLLGIAIEFLDAMVIVPCV